MDNTFYEAVLNSLEGQLAVIDRDGRIIFINDSWIRFGIENGARPENGWIGTNYIDVCKAASAKGDKEAAAAVNGISSVLAGEQDFFYLEYPCHSPDEKRWFILRMTPVRGFDGKAYVVSHQNITRRKLSEEAAEHLSLHDSLTGLANRRHFDNFLSDEWRRAYRNGGPVCLLMIDLDHFKQFNDEKGHLEGDSCLKAVANMLRKQATRGTDLSARFGGDEFSVVLGGTPQKGGLFVASKILEAIRGLGLRTDAGDLITASIGMACRIPGRDMDCTDRLALIALADAALYEAKSRGRNRVEAK